MARNTFGHLWTITTFGESHGPAIGVIVDGVPAGIDITEAEIQVELDRRKPGQSAVTTPRKESDTVEILSGVFEGKTTGVPVAFLIRNEGQRSTDYLKIKDQYRPGHADFTYTKKYGIRDYRGGGRSSARETAARVAAGALAKKFLAGLGISVRAYTQSVGHIEAQTVDFDEIERNPVRCPDAQKAKDMEALIKEIRATGDSIGGVLEAVVSGCPVGLGEPLYDKLDAMLAYAVMSIGAIKGIEIGLGFGHSTLKASESNDAFYMEGDKVRTKTNYCGGILGGISTGEDIVLRAVIKAPSSITIEQDTVDSNGDDTTIQVHGRHDPCLCPRAVPVLEAMIALTIADAYLLMKAYQG